MKGTHKVPGGKLLRVEFEAEGGTIRAFSLTGDFFLYPETGVDLINESLQGCPLEKEEIGRRVAETIASNSIEIVGFGPEDIADAIIGTTEKLQNEKAAAE